MNKPSIKIKFTVEYLYLCKIIVSNYLNCMYTQQSICTTKLLDWPSYVDKEFQLWTIMVEIKQTINFKLISRLPN